MKKKKQTNKQIKNNNNKIKNIYIYIEGNQKHSEEQHAAVIMLCVCHIGV